MGVDSCVRELDLVLDDVDANLIERLIDDPRQTNRALAAAVGLTDATVASRIRRLVESGAVSFSPQFDWDAAGYRVYCLAYLRVARRAPSSVGADVARHRGVLSVEVTYGASDVVAMLLAKDDDGMHQLTSEVMATDGVASVDIDHVVDLRLWFNNTAILPFEPTPLTWFPSPTADIDETDRRIIERLRVDGRESSRETARHLHVSDATVRSRRARLEDAGLMRMSLLVNAGTPGWTGRAAAHVGLVVTSDDASRDLTSNSEVMYCGASVGPHNLVAGIIASDHDALGAIVTERLWDLPGVVRVDTWTVSSVVSYRSDLARFLKAPIRGDRTVAPTLRRAAALSLRASAAGEADEA